MSTTQAPRVNPRFAPVLSIPIVAAIVLLGVWVAGGVISNDYRASMALTALWLLVSGAACVLVAWRVRALRLAVVGTYVVTAGVVGAYLGLATLREQVVDERVVSAAPAAAAGAVEVAHGRFRSHEHATAGTAAVVRLPDGRRFLTLTRFETSPGPDLRVRLTLRDSFDGGVDGAVDLGALKGNRGNQQYAIPRGVEVGAKTVVIWCRAFSAPFGSARL